jgi:Zn-dependent peptidase ImmA (M78 family)/transcriptional regulator with XRE-family HTH domain
VRQLEYLYTPGKMCDIHTVSTIETSAELGLRIREARLAHGLSQGQLAERLEIDRSALVRIEAGDRKVTALELLHLSEALGVPVAHFMHRSPAAMTSRRTALDEDSQTSERLRFSVDALLEAHLRDAEWLRDYGALQPDVKVPGGTVIECKWARKLAKRVRTYVGHPTGPLPAMAEVGEKVGLFILVIDAEGDGASLTPEPGFGVAVIGGQAPSGRRRFTAAHELGHHILRDEYQSDIGVAASRDERERLIDAFAAEFLLPLADVQERWVKQSAPSWERLVRISSEYRVSWASAVRAALCADLIEKAEASNLLGRTPQRGDFLAIVGSSPQEDLQTGSTGPSWRRAVLRAYLDGKITRPRAVEMLHGALSEDELPPLAEPEP